MDLLHPRIGWQRPKHACHTRRICVHFNGSVPEQKNILTQNPRESVILLKLFDKGGMCAFKEEVRVRYPFDDSVMHWCPIYQDSWVPVSKLAKIIPGNHTNLLTTWSDLISERIPGRTGRAKNFLHIDHFSQAFGRLHWGVYDIEQAILVFQKKTSPEVDQEDERPFKKRHTSYEEKEEEPNMPFWAFRMQQTLDSILMELKQRNDSDDFRQSVTKLLFGVNN